MSTRHDPFCKTCAVASRFLLGRCPYCAKQLTLNPSHEVEQCGPCGHAAFVLIFETADLRPLERISS